MSPKLLGLVHSVRGVVDGVHALCDELLPGVEYCDVIDDAVRRVLTAEGGLSPKTTRRICEDIIYTAESGADVVLVTCSSFSPCVDAARPLVGVPVLKIDEPMAAQAVQIGARIGVIATANTTLGPTSNLVRAQAELAHKQVEIDGVLCSEAFGYMLKGDLTNHDRIVLEQLRSLMRRCDVVVLAQASMARVADQLAPAERTTPVLSSPRSGVARAAEVMRSLP